MPAEIWIGVVMFLALLGFLVIGVPVAFALFSVALGSLVILDGGVAGLSLVATTLWSAVTQFALTAIPLFILMGAIISASGMGSRLYNALAILTYGLPGGLMVTTTLACTIMAAVSGSSVATAGAIGGLAVHEMRRHGHRDSEACGAVAAGGTLGILIPPSIPMIVYGIIAEQSIGHLFIASIVPGLIMASAFAAYQIGMAYYRGEPMQIAGVNADDVTFKMRFWGFVELAPIAVLIWIILGSIYEGIATPTEAAALGAIATLLLSAIIYRELTWLKLLQVLQEAARSSVMVLMIIAAAMLFGYAMTTTGVAPVLSSTIANLNVAPWLVFIAIMLLILFLGCFMETLSIIVITTPILVPIVKAFGWDMTWFGIIFMINMEAALITPPVGLNLFVVQGVVRDVRLEKIIRGTVPYVMIMLLVLALIAIFPGLTSLLGGQVH